MATINAINSTINASTSGVVFSSNVGLLSSNATTANQVQIGNASGNLTGLTVGTNGQVIVGSSGAAPVFATLAGTQGVTYTTGAGTLSIGLSAVPNSALANSSITVSAGTGVTISGSPVSLGGTITVNAAGGGLTWSVITANQTAAVNNGYICNKAGTLALALPSVSAVGDMVAVTGINTATGWQITQASGQQIFFGTTSTTLGATGTLTSSAIRDVIEIVCITANTTWQVVGSIGNITVV